MASYLRTEIRRTAKTLVTVMPSGKTVQMASGSRLWEAVQLTGTVMGDHCGGRARCNVCHVIVLEGGAGLSKMRKNERAQLAQINGVEPRSRLSCQVVLGIHRVTIEWVKN